MKLFVTVYEQTAADALAAIRALDLDHDGIELRAERFGAFDPAQFRAATRKTLLLTYRGQEAPAGMRQRALEAGFDLVDVEFGAARTIDVPRERVVLSHHDYEAVPDLEPLLKPMTSARCAHVKIAATPKDFADNQRLLAATGSGVSVIGMGERGLYSRILAPFRGSELSFVSTGEDRSAAPGQITLERALAIFGRDRQTLRADRVFAIVGNPAGHSLSPSIHNELFRRKRVSAAYTIASVQSFSEIEDAFLAGDPCGLSVTAPFKQDAFSFAERIGASIGENARASGAVNTLVRGQETVAENTDVDGFETILRQVCGRDRKTAALIGSGGTARAARVALQRLGLVVQEFNRANLQDVSSFDGEILVNTLPAGVHLQLPLKPGMAYIKAAYGHQEPEYPGVDFHGGLELLHAQAVRQHELFMKVFE